MQSGARYAVNDRESATECIEENKILRRIARHCIDETEGLFITLPEDDLAYQKTFIQACTESGIEAVAIDPKLAMQMEPSVNPALVGAVVVPDGSIDPFRLTASNMLDATENGAKVFTYCEVKGLIREGGKVIGVNVYDHKNRVERQFFAPVVVNAGGIWGQGIAEYADLKIRMFPVKGALLVMGHRINKMVINRCRKPADADILVPGDTISVIGTTSSRIPYDQIDNMIVTPEEVDILFREGEKLAPSLRHTRVLRAYAGVRPLVATDDDPSGRNVSRGIVLLDHQERDGLEGFITITGGKLMTYRLMAEWATDLVCKKLNKTDRCVTTEKALPGSSESRAETNSKVISLPSTIRYSAVYRHGSRATRLLDKERLDRSLVCECEAVTAGEVRYAVDELSVNNLVDLRRRTRVGMGSCQAELCACRAAGLMTRFEVATPRQSTTQLASFMEERWRGIEPIAWGDVIREADFTSWIYYSLLGLNDVQPLAEQAQHGTDSNEF
ncbi:anaerobic glycerol-3-phosphate dehydrogenase subunit A [Glaesserella parasuis]|nr:anaerobic glycerol-3-phosphate dehydrogenase subunit A [Glaesserella parasuis]